MRPDARRKLVEAQRELLQALLEGAPAPDGFDGERLTVAAEVLREKRSRQRKVNHQESAETGRRGTR